MNAQTAKSIAKVCLVTTLGVVGLTYANNPNIYKEIEERQAYKEEIREQGLNIRPSFEQELAESIKRIKTKNKYTVIRSADWCIPCKELERQLKQRNALDDVVILEANGRLEEIKSRLAFESLGIKTPAMPTIIIKENNKIAVYIGARYSASDPRKYVTFDTSGNEIGIDEVIKK